MYENSTNHSCYDLFGINKNKLIWHGDLPQLKAFVATEVNQINSKNAIWRSPSGGTWCFKGDGELSVTWHSKSKTISFDGKAADGIKERIYEAISAKLTAPSPSVENTSKLPTAQSLYGTEEFKAGCGDCYKLTLEMAEVKLEVAMLSALVNKLEMDKRNPYKKSAIVSLNHASTQTSVSSVDKMADQTQLTLNSRTHFDNQLNSYRQASKMKFNAHKQSLNDNNQCSIGDAMLSNTYYDDDGKASSKV